MVVSAAALASGRPLVGAALLAPFGLARGLGPVLAFGVRSPGEGAALVDRLDRSASRVRWRVANGVALAAVLVAALARYRTLGAPPDAGALAGAVLALTFAAAAVAKLARWSAWRRALSTYGLPPGTVAPIAIGVPMLELAIAMLPFLGLVSTAGGAALVTLAVFSAALVVERLRVGRRLECGCFGSSASRDYRLLLARNLVLGAAALVALRAGANAPVFRSLGSARRLRVGAGGVRRPRDRARRLGRRRGPQRDRREAGPMRRRVLWLGALAVVSVLAFGVPAAAYQTDQTDPNDTAGRLDLATVRFDHEGAPRWRFATFGTWTVRSMWDRGYLIVQLDTKGDPAVDFVAVVRSDGRRLVAHLFRLRRGGGQTELTALRSEKATSRAAWVVVPLREVTIGPNRTSYFWSALSSFTGGNCSTAVSGRGPGRGDDRTTAAHPDTEPDALSPTPSPSPSVAPPG